MKSRRSIIVWVVFLLCITGVAIGIIRARVPSASSALASPTTAAAIGSGVPTAQAKFTEFVDRIEAKGHIGSGAPTVARLTFPQAGILETIAVHVGDTVHVGQPLAEINRTSLAIALRQAEAGTAAAGALEANRAKANLAARRLRTIESGGDSATADRLGAESAARQASLKTIADDAALKRGEQLYAAGVIAAKDLAAARTQLEADRADERAARARAVAAARAVGTNVQSGRTDVAIAEGDLATLRAQRRVAEAAAASAATAYDGGILRASIDGIVTAVNKQPGESVDATSPVVEINAAAGNVLTLSIPGEQRYIVRPGMAVDVSAGTSHYSGRIASVLPGIDVTTQTVRAIVACGIPNGIAGDPVRASVEIARRRGIVIPKSAVVEDPQSGKTVVFIRRAHPSADQPAFVQREVTVGGSDAKSTLILHNVRAGESIAVTGAYTLLAPTGG